MMIKQAIFTQVYQELKRCLECNTCLESCPIYEKTFSIKDINAVLKNQGSISTEIMDFTFSCTQCRQCVPVCPQYLHRDKMLLALKHIIRTQKPRCYQRYLLIRGPKLAYINTIFQKLFVFYRKLRDRDIASFMENHEITQESLLFYPGCYIYSPETIRRTFRLLNHVGISYSVLAGVSYCCGMPHYLQGEFQQAETCLSHLNGKLKKINPTTIISGCSECLEAIQLLNKFYHTSYQTLSIVEFLMQHKERFPKIKSDQSVSLHDACRYRRQKTKNTTARLAIKTFGNLKEMPDIKQDAMCCAHWNYEAYSKNSYLRQKRLHQAKKTAPIMACECLTCYEHYSKIDTDVQVIDILELFEKSLDKNTKT